MSYVMAVPEVMDAAATDLATIGDTINAAHMTAAASTVAVLPAAADEVSTSIAHLVSGYGQDYQKLAGEAAAFHEQFVQRLTASAGSYASAEAANVSSLEPLTAIADSPAGAAAADSPLIIDLTGPFSLFLGIIIGVPLLLSLVAISIVAPGVLRGLVALMNGRG